MLVPVLVIPPAANPVTLVEAKAHLNVDYADDDTLIEGLIASATQHLDGYSGILGRALVTQTWEIRAPYFGNPVRLPLMPVQSVVVEYLDSSGVTTIADAGLYQILTDNLGPYVVLRSGSSWPTISAAHDAVRVVFVTGYGAPAAVPAPIRIAILLMVGHWYANRETVAPQGLAVLPLGADALLAPYRRYSL